MVKKTSFVFDKELCFNHTHSFSYITRNDCSANIILSKECDVYSCVLGE